MFTAADKGPDEPLPGCPTPHPAQGSFQPGLKIPLRKARILQVTAQEEAQAGCGKGSCSETGSGCKVLASVLRRCSASRPPGSKEPSLSI